MKIFSKLYLMVLTWAQHKHSVYYLATISMLESFILPYPPPDLLLAPIVLKNKNKAYYNALVCTVFSVLGGVIGYIIGYFAFNLAHQFVESLNYINEFNTVKSYFNQYGIMILFVAGFSPVPYKIFTIVSGVVAFNILLFIVISLIARGLRFYLVAFIVKRYGDNFDVVLRKYIDYLGYLLIVVLAFIIIIN